MKVSAFHLMPHRELPADFEQRYPSVWVTPPWWVSPQCSSQAARHHSGTRRSRSALAITDTELRLIAALAIIGDRSRPKTG